MDYQLKKLKKCCYVQPPVREPFKPTEFYLKPTIPFSDETTYRRSYMPFDSDAIAASRPLSFAPQYEYVKSDDPVASATVYSESYRLPGTFIECDSDHGNNTIVVMAENCDELSSLATHPEYTRNGLCGNNGTIN